MSSPLYVAFIWHMHQPFYKDTETGRYSLPWVRLHAAKDYLHVAEIISDFPRIHQTINVVPSLAEQLDDYAAGKAIDAALEVSLKTSLTDGDKKYLLDTFFSINWNRFVWPTPRYAQLARLREAVNGDATLLADPFWTDLIVWFNLAWIDPSARQRDLRLKALEAKGKNFDRADVGTILDYHREVCGKVLPAYRKLTESGHIELSTTPYFHPILPLLIDGDSARESRPQVELPNTRIAFADDAADHLARALAFHERVFGRAPNGIWPAEGSVSQAMIELVNRFHSVRWIATDEHVLERALGTYFQRDGYGHLNDARPLYQPYRVDRASPCIFFRDQTLSDRIGFVYQHMDTSDAVNDFVGRLLRMADQQANDPRPHVVSIILDGENCWEHYPNNGDDFLRSLFYRISHEHRLQTVTPSEYLERFDVIERLSNLPAASWIGSSFDTWIGEPDQNRAWEYLALAREHLAAWERRNLGQSNLDSPPTDLVERFERARLALRVAEGSDWFWWYYSHNRLSGENMFDAAFRRHLANVYQAIGDPVPNWLERPIDGHAPLHRKGISGLLSLPKIIASDRAVDRWSKAGYVEPETSTVAMQQGATFFRRLYYGYDTESLYFRVETTAELDHHNVAIFVGSPSAPAANAFWRSDGDETGRDAQFSWKIELPNRDRGRMTVERASGDGGWTAIDAPGDAAVGTRAVELKIERSSLGIEWGSAVHVAAGVLRDGTVVEAIPTRRAETFLLADVPGTHPEHSLPEGDRDD